MGKTMFQQAVEKTVYEKMNGDNNWGRLLADTVLEIQAKNVYPQSYVDVIGQKSWHRGGFDIFDAYSFLQTDYAIKTGELAVFQIPVDKMPGRDSDYCAMNEVLGKLQFPFSGEFWGGTQGEDGEISWELPVNALMKTPGIVGYVIVSPTILDNGEKVGCPLEVGTTSFHKTRWYTMGTRIPGVARWPYGQDKITVIVNSGIHAMKNEGFDELRESVWGDFDSLPNPFEYWNAEIERLAQ